MHCAIRDLLNIDSDLVSKALMVLLVLLSAFLASTAARNREAQVRKRTIVSAAVFALFR